MSALPGRQALPEPPLLGVPTSSSAVELVPAGTPALPGSTFSSAVGPMPAGTPALPETAFQGEESLVSDPIDTGCRARGLIDPGLGSRPSQLPSQPAAHQRPAQRRDCRERGNRGSVCDRRGPCWPRPVSPRIAVELLLGFGRARQPRRPIGSRRRIKMRPTKVAPIKGDQERQTPVIPDTDVVGSKRLGRVLASVS